MCTVGWAGWGSWVGFTREEGKGPQQSLPWGTHGASLLAPEEINEHSRQRPMEHRVWFPG